MLGGEHLDSLRGVFATVCADFGARLVKMNGEDDHVHPRVEYPPKVAVPTPVNSLKGLSSWLLRKRYRIRTHREHLWSPSYLAASCGGAPLSITCQYVEQRQRPDQAHGQPRLDGARATRFWSPGQRGRPAPGSRRTPWLVRLLGSPGFSSRGRAGHHPAASRPPCGRPGGAG